MQSKIWGSRLPSRGPMSCDLQCPYSNSSDPEWWSIMSESFVGLKQIFLTLSCPQHSNKNIMVFFESSIRFMCHRIPIFKLLHAHVLFIHVYKFHWDTSIFWWGQKILGPGCHIGTQVMWPKIPIFELAQHRVVIYHVWKFRWAEANPSKLIMSTPNKQTNKQESDM